METPVMLRGRTAEQWSRFLGPLGVVLVGLTIAFGAAYFLSGATAATMPAWLYVLAAFLGASFVAAMSAFFAMMVKAIRESKAGYTTTGGMYPELPQFDSETGEVLREATGPQR